MSTEIILTFAVLGSTILLFGKGMAERGRRVAVRHAGAHDGYLPYIWPLISLMVPILEQYARGRTIALRVYKEASL